MNDGLCDRGRRLVSILSSGGGLQSLTQRGAGTRTMMIVVVTTSRTGARPRGRVRAMAMRVTACGLSNVDYGSGSLAYRDSRNIAVSASRRQRV